MPCMMRATARPVRRQPCQAVNTVIARASVPSQQGSEPSTTASSAKRANAGCSCACRSFGACAARRRFAQTEQAEVDRLPWDCTHLWRGILASASAGAAAPGERQQLSHVQSERCWWLPERQPNQRASGACVAISCRRGVLRWSHTLAVALAAGAARAGGLLKVLADPVPEHGVLVVLARFRGRSGQRAVARVQASHLRTNQACLYVNTTCLLNGRQMSISQ